MLDNMTFDEYYDDISDESFTESDCDNARKLWDLLHKVSPFNEEEQGTAFVLGPDVNELLCYSRDCGHMDEETFDALQAFLDFIFDDPMNGFLADMLLEYFTDL